MGRACSANGRRGMHTGFDEKMRRKETTKET
jgi:hypothetical protein